MEARSVLCVALILASCLSQARTFPEDMRILAFGDSLTSGVGGSGTNYPEQLSMWLRVEVINAGGNGETSEDGLRRLSPALRKWQPHLLILCLGLNDAANGIDPEQTRRNLIEMLQIAREHQVPSLVLALPAHASAVADPLYASAAKAGKASIDDFSMVSVLSNPALKAGLVHANREGYKQLALSLAERLRETWPLLEARRHP